MNFPSISLLVPHLPFPSVEFAIAYLIYFLIGPTWICSGESTSKDTSDGSDTNSQDVSAVSVVYVLPWVKI